jgi:hypothetical protein
VTGHLSNGLRAVAFLSITIVLLAGGCKHPRSTPEGTTVTNEVSNALIGKKITIHGKFSLWGKFGAYVVLDNQQLVDLEPRGPGTFTWGKPYSEMEGKLVEATGTLRFYHEPPAEPSNRTVARAPDHYYFAVETAQLRIISP